MTIREVPITPEQASEFAAAHAAAQITAARVNGIATGILAGHGITDGTVESVKGTTMRVLVPDEPPEAVG